MRGKQLERWFFAGIMLAYTVTVYVSAQQPDPAIEVPVCETACKSSQYLEMVAACGKASGVFVTTVDWNDISLEGHCNEDAEAEIYLEEADLGDFP